MKLRIGVVVVTIVLQLFAAVTPLIPGTAGWWATPDLSLLYSRITTLVGIEIALLTLAVSLLHLMDSRELRHEFDALSSASPRTLVKWTSEQDFHKQFLHALAGADHIVKICYFAPYPPMEVDFPERRKYYDKVFRLMRRNSNVTFKRIIRSTPANLPWASQLVSRLQGKPNVELALLTCDLPPDQNMPLALSVQIIDDTKAWLVAVATHEPDQGFRDLFIENTDITDALAKYFDRLWSLSDILLDHGRITSRGQEIVTQTRER